MENKLFYYNWFKKVMSIFIDTFFVAAPFASLYVFTSFLAGTIRIVAFAGLIAVYFVVIHFFKDRIKTILNLMLKKVEQADSHKLLLIIIFASVVIKAVFTIFFNFDATSGGDVQIYNDIAEKIISTGDIHSDAISHLYGVALHLVLIKLLGLPLHVGIFLVFLTGTVINYLSFKDIVGKNKAFLLIMLYLIMPSTALMTFCPTHELFVYMYVSVFLFSFNRMLRSKDTAKIVIYSLLMTMATILTCFVNPGGYIIYIIMILSIVLSNVKVNKKVIIAVCLVLSVISSNAISKYLNVNEYTTAINTYTILIHGTNPEALGEQIDGYPLKQMRMYIYENTMDFSDDGFLDAAKHVFINQCIYLFTHPVIFVRLIVHKFYILWSGVHYPIELANFYGAISGPIYYLFLALSTIIYLTVLTIGNVYKRKLDDEIEISNFKLELLGVIALTMVCIVVNKYSLYVTLFIFLISFYRSCLGDEDER